MTTAISHKSSAADVATVSCSVMLRTVTCITYHYACVREPYSSETRLFGTGPSSASSSSLEYCGVFAISANVLLFSSSYASRLPGHCRFPGFTRAALSLARG